MAYTDADLAYIEANYSTLEELCADRDESAGDVRRLIEQRRLPRPSYVMDDGTEMYPHDYFRLPDEAGGVEQLRSHFDGRLRAAGDDDVDEQWEGYLSGIYAVCLRDVTPETIARKTKLVTSLCELLVLAKPRDPEWRDRLRREVDELDELEREFAPDYDRNEERFGCKPTRDLVIATARERYPEVFGRAPAARTVTRTA